MTGFVVDVEAHVSTGFPGFVLGGLGDSAVAQSPGRIKAAANAIGMEASQRNVTVNLSPAGVRKAGAGFDLAVFVAVAVAMKKIEQDVVVDVMHLGELGLDGSVRGVPGVLPAVHAAARAGVGHAVVPVANAHEASLVSGIKVHPVAHVSELVSRYEALHRGRPVQVVPVPPRVPAADRPSKDLVEVVGQAEAKYALEIAAAGGHHLLLAGPPGAGKTMLAERLPGLLPSLDEAESLEVTAIHSVLGVLGEDVALMTRPPFVAPHHGASQAAIIGGGSGRIRPGSITQAHRGVLFLDETPEFDKAALQALRTPLEHGSVSIARSQETVYFPCRFQLILAANPCPCGKGWGKGLDCTCSPMMIRNYFSKLSGPLLDRVDLQVHVRPPGLSMAGQPLGETSEVVARRVARARSVQQQRWRELYRADGLGLGSAIGRGLDAVPEGAASGLAAPASGDPWPRLNSDVPGSVLRTGRLRLPASSTAPVDRSLERGGLSLRGYDRCLRIAWTIADLAELQRPGRDEVDLAVSLRHHSEVAA